jgi:hypothetical protein
VAELTNREIVDRFIHAMSTNDIDLAAWLTAAALILGRPRARLRRPRPRRSSLGGPRLAGYVSMP